MFIPTVPRRFAERSSLHYTVVALDRNAPRRRVNLGVLRKRENRRRQVRPSFRRKVRQPKFSRFLVFSFSRFLVFSFSRFLGFSVSRFLGFSRRTRRFREARPFSLAADVKISGLHKIGVFRRSPNRAFHPIALRSRNAKNRRRKTPVPRPPSNADLGKRSAIQRRKLSQNFARTRRADRQSRRDRFILAFQRLNVSATAKFRGGDANRRARTNANRDG